MIPRRSGDDFGQIGVHRDCQLGAGLLLPNIKYAVANMLPTHSHHVRPPLSGTEQQGERKAGARSNWMLSLELRDLIIGPAVIAVRVGSDRLYVAGRVVGP